ncbi:MAG TPA: hypothetical protein VMQ62_04270 [Dongiaceae bacterium]|nr:hypothetical protein [Dongiaceae bacterium]
MSHCLRCGANLSDQESTCEGCGRLIAGARRVAQAPLEEEAALLYDLLESAGFEPILAWLESGDRPRPVPRERSVAPAAGLLPPVTTPFAVYVREEDADEATLVLEDARRQGVSEEPASF